MWVEKTYYPVAYFTVDYTIGNVRIALDSIRKIRNFTMHQTVHIER